MPSLVTYLVRWESVAPEVPIVRDSSWKVLYDDTLAEPGEALWRSPITRFPDTSAHKARLRDGYSGHAFWLGVEISPEAARAASKRGAHYLMLGHFWSKYEIWVDGHHVSDGVGLGDPTPAIVPLALDSLSGDRPVRVAVRAWHDAEYPAPDHLCDDLPPGLLTRETAASYVALTSFWERVRPFALTLCYALIAGLFFLFWVPTPSRQEYSYLALFAISGAAYQARWTDLLYWNFDRGTNLVADLFVNSYTAGFAMLLGFAFARLRRSVFRAAVPAVVVLPIVLALAFPGVEARFAARQALYLWFEPAAFALGGISCLLQALHLFRHAPGRLPHRVRRLVMVGAGMIAAGAYYFLLKRGVGLGTHRHYWNGFEHLVLMLYFAVIALREYGEHQALVHRSPVSQYHRRPVLPERVRGVLLAMDLKSSEPFYRLRATLGGEDLVSLWRSHVSAAMNRHGGTVVLRKGDEIAAFFESDSLAPALEALEDAANASALLADEHRHLESFPPEAEGFFFRAAVSAGHLRPIWEQEGSHREAGWEGVGENNPFLDCARLMELEKKLPKGRSRAVLRADDCAELRRARPELGSRLRRIDEELTDKHGTAYRIGLYVPLSNTGLDELGLEKAA